MADTSELLTRIASALDIPVEVFSVRREDQNGHRATLEEVADLINAFQKIEDRQARRRCLSYVRLTAEQKRSR